MCMQILCNRTIVIQIMAESCDEQGQSGSCWQLSLSFHGLQHQVGSLQRVACVSQVVVGVVMVARCHACNEGGQAPCLQSEHCHEAGASKNVIDEAQLQHIPTHHWNAIWGGYPAVQLGLSSLIQSGYKNPKDKVQDSMVALR